MPADLSGYANPVNATPRNAKSGISQQALE
jgi:hypothetical protein